jgi:hypothetical protein
MKDFLDAVIAIQGRTTDAEFSKKLGVHRVNWTNKRNRRKPLTASDILQPLQVFPELRPLFFSENATPNSKPVIAIEPR